VVVMPLTLVGVTPAAPGTAVAIGIARMEHDHLGRRGRLAQRGRITDVPICRRRSRRLLTARFDDNQRRGCRVEGRRPGYVSIAGGPAKDQEAREDQAG
jgi:hypothetical protein